MRKITTIYLFISIFALSLFNINNFSLAIYALALLLSIATNSLYGFIFFALGLPIANSPTIMFFYAIGGFILFILPLIKEEKLSTQLSKHFLRYTAPFYLVISAGICLYINSRYATILYCVLLVLMFLSRNLFGYFIFGLGILLLGSNSLTIIYLLSYILVYINRKLKEDYDINNSNVTYIDPNNILNSNGSKSDYLSDLIYELSILRDDIIDVTLGDNIRNIIELCEKIKEHTDSSNEYKINKLVNYYAPELITIIKDYINVEKIDIVSEENLMFKVNVMRILDTSTKAFQKILQSMADKTIQKSNIDIKVLEQMLKDENLL